MNSQISEGNPPVQEHVERNAGVFVSSFDFRGDRQIVFLECDNPTKLRETARAVLKANVGPEPTRDGTWRVRLILAGDYQANVRLLRENGVELRG